MTEQADERNHSTAPEAVPDGNTWTDIGKAEVVYTLFGRARVRIVHEGDRKRQAARMLVAAVVVAIVAYSLLAHMDDFREHELADAPPVALIPSAPVAAVSAAQDIAAAHRSSAGVPRAERPEITTASGVAAKPRAHRTVLAASAVAPGSAVSPMPRKHAQPLPNHGRVEAGSEVAGTGINSFSAPVDTRGN